MLFKLGRRVACFRQEFFLYFISTSVVTWLKKNGWGTTIWKSFLIIPNTVIRKLMRILNLTNDGSTDFSVVAKKVVLFPSHFC